MTGQTNHHYVNTLKFHVVQAKYLEDLQRRRRGGDKTSQGSTENAREKKSEGNLRQYNKDIKHVPREKPSKDSAKEEHNKRRKRRNAVWVKGEEIHARREGAGYLLFRE